MKSEKLHLRALEPQDLDLLYSWENDIRNWSITGTYIPFSKSELKQYINAAKDIYTDKQFRFVIVNNDGSVPVGFIDIFEFDAFHQRAGIGILIGNVNDRQKGFAGEALNILKEYAKDVLGIKILFCSVLADNEASIKLFSNAGFEICGTRKNWFRKGDLRVDEILMQLPLN